MVFDGPRLLRIPSEASIQKIFSTILTLNLNESLSEEA